MRDRVLGMVVVGLWLACGLSGAVMGGEAAGVLPGTSRLEVEGDLAARMVAGVDEFLLRKIAASVEGRERHWSRDFSSAEAYGKSIAKNRARLRHILGVRDERVPFSAVTLKSTTSHGSLVGTGRGFEIHEVRWPVLAPAYERWSGTAIVYGEGLLLVPTGARPRLADVVAIPDAGQTPEQIVGLTEGVPAEAQFARRLAESGCRVLVPVLISREMKARSPEGPGRATMTNREFVHRSAYELGRHIAGYELQKVLAGVDWFSKEAGEGERAKVGVIGYGEGGMLALYAAALDARIDAACVMGYFGPREGIWQQPITRNVFGLLEQFGDAELAVMAWPRGLVVEAGASPELSLPGVGGAPAELTSHSLMAVQTEYERAKALIGDEGARRGWDGFVLTGAGEDGDGYARAETLGAFLKLLGGEVAESAAVERGRDGEDVAVRQQRQLDEIDRFNQWLLRESLYIRQKFMAKLDTGSLEKYAASVEPYRDYFRHEVVGHFDDELLPPRPRSRKAYDEEKWTGYEVMLDVYPGVFACGILCLPKDIKPGEKRPVVVCQHGLEGRPQDVVTGDHRAYHDFASKLAERGFVTFAPQNPYIGKDKFRTLQRKSYPIKKTLFSTIVPQHQQIVDWLQTLPYVDGERIGFYGLSYGGKSAMRIPPLVTDYALSICSADFNEWIWKNASSRGRPSYVWTGEYEIYEFDLGNTFNYAEMAALIAPRPFMVERGHFDGVAPDERVGFEFARVRNLYAARLGIGERCEIEWFVGPHTINGKGTFAFVERFLMRGGRVEGVKE